MKEISALLLFVLFITGGCRKDPDFITTPPANDTIPLPIDTTFDPPLPCPGWDSLVFGTMYGQDTYYVHDLEATSNGDIFVLFHKQHQTFDASQNIYRSTDGGETFQYVAGGIFWNTPRTMYAFSGDTLFYMNSSGEVNVSYTNGTNWTTKAAPLYYNPLHATDNLIFTHPDTGYISSNVGVQMTTDGAASWTTTTGIDTTIKAINFPSKNIGYAITSKRCYKTTDGGYNWSPIFTDPTENLNHISFFDTDKGVFGGNKLYLTTDGGATCSIIKDIPVKSSAFKNVDSLYTITTNGTLLLSPDDGVTWQTSCNPDFGYTMIKFVNGVGYLGTSVYNSPDTRPMFIFRYQ